MNYPKIMKIRFEIIAAGLVIGGTAHAANTLPVQSVQHLPPLTSEEIAPVVQCNIPGHPHAVCWWSDPDAKECFPGPIVTRGGGFPARHYFAGGTVCWGGDERFFSIVP
jgi:hypothetical protein